MQTQSQTSTQSTRTTPMRGLAPRQGTAGSFERYIQDLAPHSPVSADKEVAHAEKVRARRGELWRTILSYPPLATSIANLVESDIDTKSTKNEDEPTDSAQATPARAAMSLDEALAAMRKASRSARSVRTTAGGDAFRKAGENLARLLVDLDTDDRIALLVVEDVQRLRRSEREGLSLKMRRAPSLNEPFVAFAKRSFTARARLRRAKSAFAEANLRLVVSMAKRFEYAKIPLADLVQEGNIGLLKAVDRFDHPKGFRFSTYATWWIRHALTRAVYNGARTIRLPVHIQERQRQITRARRELENELGHEASAEEVGSRLSLPAAKVVSAEMDKVGRTISFDTPLNPNSQATLSDSLADDAPDVSDVVSTAQLIEHLDDAYGELDAVEYDIVQRRFGLGGKTPETLREVGAVHGLSRERIRQIQARAMLKMRAALAGEAAA